LNVRVNIDHTRASDMDVFLLGPTGIRVELFTDVGGNGDHFRNTVLDSDATSSITGASAPFTGTFRPEGNLSSFNGSNLGGTWTLQVIDDQNREVGQLLNWSISVVYEPTTPPPAVAATAPWTEPFAQNASDPRDVNNDGIVSPIDALLTINALNERTGIAGQATSTRNATSNLFLDVSGDGMLSPIDTLLVINWLNEASQTSAEVVSDETPDAADTVFAAQAIAADASVSSQRLVAMRGLEIRGLDEAGITDEPLATVPSRTIVDWLKEDSLFPMLGDADEWDKVSENDRDWELMIDEVVDDVSQQW
jgi:subtilisin-like proprotein convertase family protein